tara:strand:+ start:8135 stop:8866 length:732 start_codon:yes stop_codon:yes gene_type:complete
MKSVSLAIHRIKRIERRYRPRGLFQLMMLLFAYIVGGFVKEHECSRALDRTAYYQERYQLKSEELAESMNALARETLELQIVKEKQDKLKVELKKEIAKSADLFNENVFFKSVLAPESNVKGVYIKDFKVFPTQLKRNYQFSLMLSQFDRRREKVSGRYQVKWIGIKDEKRIIYDLKEIQTKRKLSQFSFRYYQELLGEVTLPENFNLERISVKVEVPGNKWRKAKSAFREWRVKDVLVVEPK